MRWKGLLDLLPGRGYGGYGGYGLGAAESRLKGGEFPGDGRDLVLVLVAEAEVIKLPLLLLVAVAQPGEFRVAGGVLLLGEEAVDDAGLGPQDGIRDEGGVVSQGTGEVQELVLW